MNDTIEIDPNKEIIDRIEEIINTKPLTKEQKSKAENLAAILRTFSSEHEYSSIGQYCAFIKKIFDNNGGLLNGEIEIVKVVVGGEAEKEFSITDPLAKEISKMEVGNITTTKSNKDTNPDRVVERILIAKETSLADIVPAIDNTNFIVQGTKTGKVRKFQIPISIEHTEEGSKTIIEEIHLCGEVLNIIGFANLKELDATSEIADIMNKDDGITNDDNGKVRDLASTLGDSNPLSIFNKKYSIVYLDDEESLTVSFVPGKIDNLTGVLEETSIDSPLGQCFLLRSFNVGDRVVYSPKKDLILECEIAGIDYINTPVSKEPMGNAISIGKCPGGAPASTTNS